MKFKELVKPTRLKIVISVFITVLVMILIHLFPYGGLYSDNLRGLPLSYEITELYLLPVGQIGPAPEIIFYPWNLAINFVFWLVVSYFVVGCLFDKFKKNI
jgi:hypothetical protein